MTASSDTLAERRRRRRSKKVDSPHVAPRGQRERVAQPRPRARPENIEPPRRRSRGRSQRSRSGPPVERTQPRAGQLDIMLSARMMSAVLLLILLGVLALFFQSDAFYVRRIEVGGLNFLTAEEVFALSDVASLHVFWVDPAAVREAIMQESSVADAEVRIGWPPHLVQVEIRERQPALIWEQAGVRTWIDVRGRVMPQRSDVQGLLRVVVQDVENRLGENVVIPQEVIDGALQLRNLFPEIEVLLYDPLSGLGYQDVRGWRAWFGTGTNMPAKLNVYDAIVQNLMARDVYPQYIDVGDINAPYYRVWWEGDAAATSESEESQAEN